MITQFASGIQKIIEQAGGLPESVHRSGLCSIANPASVLPKSSMWILVPVHGEPYTIKMCM